MTDISLHFNQNQTADYVDYQFAIYREHFVLRNLIREIMVQSEK